MQILIMIIIHFFRNWFLIGSKNKKIAFAWPNVELALPLSRAEISALTRGGWMSICKYLTIKFFWNQPYFKRNESGRAWIYEYQLPPPPPNLSLTQSKTLQTCWKLSILLVNFIKFGKPVKIRFVAICHLQICYNLLKQLSAILLTTCNRLVVNKQSQAERTHPDISLL